MNKKTEAASEFVPECTNCRYFKAAPVVIIGATRGQCAAPPPPIVAQLYSMLQQEPNLRVSYEAVFNDLPDALLRGACALHKPVVLS